jgi:Rps23 Pro-64 3,4-dihydroxylase Tpa1-like proline 4-hydroxylase
MSSTITAEKNLLLQRWVDHFDGKSASYSAAQPFPHLVIDNFLPEQLALQCARAFPFSNSKTWTNYVHVNEKKFGLDKRPNIPPSILDLIDQLQTLDFTQLLSRTTSIPGLIADEDLTGGGLHQIHPGGFLNIHSDFLIHPHKTNLERRINLILFLSDEWKNEYGGDLEFWNKDMTACITRVEPRFNRCVIFTTDEYSFHGCPELLKGPAGFSRKSLALYYYTEYAEAPQKQFTHYKARPGDRKVLIWLDNQALAMYSFIKRKFKIDDRLVSRILGLFKGRR